MTVRLTVYHVECHQKVQITSFFAALDIDIQHMFYFAHRR